MRTYIDFMIDEANEAHNGALGISFLSEDARHWYTIAITVDPETGKQLASERVNFPDEVAPSLLHASQ